MVDIFLLDMFYIFLFFKDLTSIIALPSDEICTSVSNSISIVHRYNYSKFS